MNERPIRKYKNGSLSRETLPFADECRVDIMVDGCHQASVMTSPVQLDALAVGFLFGEDIIGGFDDLKSISVKGQEIFVELSQKNARPQPMALESLDAEPVRPLTIAYPALDVASILRLSEEFDSRSYLLRQTGAVHSCSLISGSRHYHADDVARHNALDKVIGEYLLDGRSGEPGLVLSTGRLSTEILIKTAKIGLGAVISRSAATDHAVQLARKLNMITIGFSRQNRFNVYHGGEMIEGAPPRN